MAAARRFARPAIHACQSVPPALPASTGST